MPDDFQSSLRETLDENFPETQIKDEKELKKESEKAFLKKIKKRNRDYLVDLSLLEKERVARHIKELYDENKEKHEELEDKIDEWDEVYRMTRKTLPGDDGSMPNYRTPMSTVTHEVVHSNIMNVFFTPKDLMRILPTEEGDVPKVKKLATFGNWSMKNELHLFENIDRLFHNSGKNGECPYILHWVKEYGVEIKREIIPDPRNPEKPLIDEETQEPFYQEIEEPKLLYNAPKLEIFSRKDYIQPNNALMGKKPPWEARRIRLNYDQYLKDELQGKMYPGSIKEIKDWGGDNSDTNIDDYEGDAIPVGKWEKEFIEFYLRLRITTVKRGKDNEVEEYQELEDEFIAIINIDDEVLCSLRKNKFPLKERPIGMDYFIPDDEGRRAGIGIMEFMDSIQTGYDALYNQYIFGVIQSNNPFGFFTPMGNQRDEPIKIKNGYMYPTSDAKSINIVKLPPPDKSLQLIMDLVRYWAQMLFGISDYSAGMESKIDPSAPAKKAEIVVAQGNVRLNTIIKRKNKTLQDIFRRWYLLYRDNMPPNKFMRIAGEDKDNPWKFEAVNMGDFALKSIPDFELTGNILNVNKTFEANKAIAVYNLLAQNPFFMPQTAQGIQALHSLTKWLIDKLDETGLSRFLPPAQGDTVHTPEEENARFLQGDYGEPTEQEDHQDHIIKHRNFIMDESIPDDVKKLVFSHIKEHVEMLRKLVTQQMVMQQAGITQAGTEGGQNVQAGTNQGTPQAAGGVVQGQPAGVA